MPLFSALLALALADQLQPAPPAAQPAMHLAVITNPDLIRRPTYKEFSKAYPRIALRARQEGSARVRCTVAADGRLTPCQVEAEDPPGWGFGDAALKLAAVMVARPQTMNGIANDRGVINQTFRFVMPR